VDWCVLTTPQDAIDQLRYLADVIEMMKPPSLGLLAPILWPQSYGAADRMLWKAASVLQHSIEQGWLDGTIAKVIKEGIADSSNVDELDEFYCALAVKLAHGMQCDPPPSALFPERRAVWSLRTIALLLWKVETKRFRDKGSDRGEYLSPAECIERLPLKGLTDRQKRYKLDRVRNRCTWLRKNAKGHVHADDWNFVTTMLKMRSLSKTDVSDAIETLPADPTKDEIERLKAEINQQNLDRKRSRK
jgi:hypothetical protein